jgi:hypothetical protein
VLELAKDILLIQVFALIVVGRSFHDMMLSSALQEMVSSPLPLLCCLLDGTFKARLLLFQGWIDEPSKDYW